MEVDRVLHGVERALKQEDGSQTYDLPKGKDLSMYTTLLVWSKKEKRAVASAEWHAASGGMMDHM